MSTPSIRKTKTGSGATAVQVVRYKKRRVVVLKHLGSAHTEPELETLVAAARSWIVTEWPQPPLLPPTSNRLLHLDHAQFVGIRYSFAYTILHRLITECGFASLTNRLLLDLVAMRIFEPCSKLQSLVLLKRYFGIEHSERSLYRTLPTLINLKKKVVDLAISFATAKLAADLAFVLYDVTTLYFESFTADELKKPGFSKDNKFNQPQIVVGLLVTPAGFPLSYDVFAGNTFEGHTMLPVLTAFRAAHATERLTVVADAGMLSAATMAALTTAGFSYIVGGRVANLPAQVIDQLATDLKHTDGATIRVPTKQGDLIGEFSLKRFRKDQHEMEKQLIKAAGLIKKQEPGKRAKFVAVTKTKEGYALNTAVVAKTTKLLGIKGYYTNLPSTTLSNTAVIAHYHELWHVEQSFRLAKSDLVARPIFHYKKEAIQAHMLICFMALAVGKYAELKTGMSLRRIVELLRSVADATIVDGLTKQTAVLRSELSGEVKNFLKKFGMSY